MVIERKQRLDSLGFIWDDLVAAWEEGFAALQKFHAREHHCRVIDRHLEGTYRLGQWIAVQRNTKDSMLVERKQKLDALGFDWDPTEADWKAGFAALERFKARKGHCRVPWGHLEDNYKLGQWVANQRRKKVTMPVEHRQKLEALGFEWYPYAADWEEGFAALGRFKGREGHCRVNVVHTEGTFGLGQWVSTQRKQRNSIPVERRQRLDALGFIWRVI